MVRVWVESFPSLKLPIVAHDAKIAHTSDAALFLLHAKGAKKRMLVLTDPSFYRLYLRTRQGQMVQRDGVTLELIKC